MRIMDTIISYSYKPITSNKVGSWRFVEPYLKEKLPPCQNECPIQHSIREIYSLLEDGKEKEAFFLMAEKNPLLYATGTVCPHFCEQGCNRQFVDESLAVSNTESYLGEKFLNQNLNVFQKSLDLNKKIAVIGAGPAGLSIAYQLAQYGASIDIFERESEAGGIIRYGIPDARINKAILKKEIEKMLSSFPKIKIQYNQNISPKTISEMESRYDKIFIAAGLHESQPSPFDNVQNGLEVLKNYHKGQYQFPKNGRYLVLGGGNTAMDVAFYLLENKNQVSVLVRREKSKMRAFAHEIETVEKKGANIYDLSELKRWEPETKKAVLKLQDKEEIWDVDGVFVCFGQQEESMWKNLNMSSKVRKIGDISGITATVVHATADAYQAAYEYLTENGFSKKLQEKREIISSEKINLDYWKNKKEARNSDILIESKRCMQCGTCTGCRVCETFCPDFAVEIRNNQADFDKDYCKGCEICFTECPRGAISIMEANKE